MTPRVSVPVKPQGTSWVRLVLQPATQAAGGSPRRQPSSPYFWANELFFPEGRRQPDLNRRVLDLKSDLADCFTDPQSKDRIHGAVVEAVQVEPALDQPFELGLTGNKSWQLGYIVACLMAVFPEHWDPEVDYWATGALEGSKVTAGLLLDKLNFILRQSIRGTCVFGPDPLAVLEMQPPPTVQFKRHAVNSIEDLIAPGSPMAVEGKFGEFKLGRCASNQARAAVDTVARLRRFLPSATVERSMTLRTIEDFLVSDSSALTIVAPSGAGKTSLMALIALRYAERSLERPTLYLPGHLLRDASQLDRRILEDLGFPDSYSMGNFLTDGREAAARTPLRRIVVVVDAVDEHPESVELLRHLGVLIAQAHASTTGNRWLKFIVSIRDTAYASVGLPARLHMIRGSDPYYWPPIVEGGRRDLPGITLGRFDGTEAKTAFELYLSKEQPENRTTSTWEDLEGTPTAEVLSNPLNMRLLLEAYRGRDIPPNVHWSRVVREYYEKVICQAAERATLAGLLAEMMESEGEAWLERRSVVGQQWFSRPAFDQLVSLGVLVDIDQKVRFRDGHVLAYILSLCLDKRGQTPEGLQGIAARATQIKPVPVQDALVAMLIRQCLEGRFDGFVRLVDEAIPDKEAGAVSLGAAEEVLAALARDGQVDSLLTAMTKVASNNDETLLLRVADSLVVEGFTTAALAVATSCCEEARREANPAIEAQAETLRTELFLTEQRLKEAKASIARAVEVAPADKAALWAQLRLVELLRSQKEWIEAERVCHTVIGRAESVDKRILGHAHRALGVLMGTAEAELEHYTRALRLLRECRDSRGVAHCNNNLAILMKGTGRWGRAVELYDEAWRAYQDAGDRLDMGMVAMNRGWLHKDRGELREAEAWYQKAIRLAVAVSSHLQVANRESALGEVREIRGDLVGARQHYVRSVAIREEYDEAGRDTTLTLRALGRLSLRLGRLKKARWLFETEKQSAAAEKNHERMMYALQNLARLEEWEQSHDQAILDLEEGLRSSDRFGYRMPFLFGLSSVHLYRREAGAAGQYVEDYETLASGDGMEPLFQRRARMLRARLHILTGQTPDVAALLTEIDSDWDTFVGCFHPEDGPAPAYMDGAERLLAMGEVSAARLWVDGASKHVAGRPWYPWEERRLRMLRKQVE